MYLLYSYRHCAQTEWMNEYECHPQEAVSVHNELLVVNIQFSKFKQKGYSQVHKTSHHISLSTYLVNIEVPPVAVHISELIQFELILSHTMNTGSYCLLPWWPIPQLSFCNSIVCFLPRLKQAFQSLLHMSKFLCQFRNLGRFTSHWASSYSLSLSITLGPTIWLSKCCLFAWSPRLPPTPDTPSSDTDSEQFGSQTLLGFVSGVGGVSGEEGEGRVASLEPSSALQKINRCDMIGNTSV